MPSVVVIDHACCQRKNDENEEFYINDYDAADRQGGE